MKKLPILILWVLISFHLTDQIYANDFSQSQNNRYNRISSNPVSGVRINWVDGIVTASSEVSLPVIIPDVHNYKGVQKVASSLTAARSMAREEAQENAIGSLMHTVLQLPLNSSFTIYEKMQQDPGLRKRMGVLGDLFKTQVRRTGEGKVHIELALPFKGSKGLYSLLLNPTYNSEKIPLIEEESYGDKISSIIIDMSEFPEFRPSLEPRIYSNVGRLIYGPEIVSQTCSLKYGLVAWKNSDASARMDSRAGSYPYYIYAGGLMGAKKSDIFLDEKDVQRILSNNSGRKALRRCSVIVILSARN